MKIKGKVHCFFEQSGTFKQEFIKLGIPAEDYDIQNNFGQTDHVIDLFAEIEKAYMGGQSVFDNITKDDLIMAFFPCIKFCNIAIMAIENKDIEKAHNNIMKVQRIIEEFQITLDFKYPIANDFNNVYNYLMRRLREANMTKDKEILEEVNGHIRTMRDTWKEVMRLAK